MSKQKKTTAIDWTDYIFESGIKAIKPSGKRGDAILWEYECFCGKHFIELPCKVKNGTRKSCGCLASINISKSKTQKSFYDWCIETSNEYILELWDYDLNEISPQEVSYKNNKPRYFKCINHNDNHHSELKYLNHIVERGISNIQCTQCNSFGQYVIDNFGLDYFKNIWSSENDANPFEISKSSSKKIFLNCYETKYHGDYQVSCHKFYNGVRCPYCNRNSGKVHKKDSFGSVYNYIMDRWSDENELDPYTLSPMCDKYIWLKCERGRHDDYITKINNAVKANFNCPMCINESTTSKLQNKVYQYITDMYGFHIDTEFNCKLNMINPTTNRILPYDNEIDEIKLIIEVNGLQHYESLHSWNEISSKRNGTTPEYELEQIKYRDSLKREHAINNGYTFLEIPYYLENNDEYKIIIDNTINKIK